MKYLLLLIPLLSSCKYVEYIGAVSMQTYNEHIEEMQKFSKDALENQGKIGEVTTELAQENVMEAKADDDEPKLERSIATRVKAEIATKEANKLAKTEFTKASPTAFDWGGILQMILTSLGVASPVGIIGMGLMGKKIGRLKNKGRKLANSTELDDISEDRDFA